MQNMRGKLTRPLPCARGAARALPHLRSCARSRVSPRRRVSATAPRLHQGGVTGRRLCAALRLPCLISRKRAGQVPDRIVPPLPDKPWQVLGEPCVFVRGAALWVFLRHVSLLAQVTQIWV